MKIFMAIAVLILLSIEKSSCTCNEQGVFTDPNNDSCQTYAFCYRSLDGTFIEKLYRCPNGTLFNPIKKNCDEKFICIPPTTLSTTTKAPKNDFQCTAQGRFPDEDDVTCSQYFFCYYLSTGKYLKRNYTCPSGTKFNPRLQTCSPTYNCNDSSTTTVASVSTSIGPKSFNCTEEGRFAVREDVTCRSYYDCLYLPDRSLAQQIYFCPSILKFDPETQTCNSNYQCSPLSSTTQSYNSTDTTLSTLITTEGIYCFKQGRFPVQEDETCRSYYYCLVLSNGMFVQQIYICPDMQKFDPKTQSCKSNYQCLQPSPKTTTKSNNFICPSAGRFPDDSDKTCRTYFYCIQLPNKEIGFQIFKCREGENFDPKLKACSENFKCSMQYPTSSFTEGKYTTAFSILTIPPVEKTTASSFTEDKETTTFPILTIPQVENATATFDLTTISAGSTSNGISADTPGIDTSI